MHEIELHHWLVVAELVLAGITVVAVTFITAPYGRHPQDGWGPRMPARLGWIVMETPAVLWFAWVFFKGRHSAEVVPLIFFGLWQIHYIHRTYIFPFRLRSKGKTMPILVAAMAFGFQSLNAYINARWISHFGQYDTSWLYDPRFIAGVLVFVGGMALNLHSDTLLLNLRKPGDKGYKIPRGGGYRWVSCPNYLGEIVEWFGFALMTWSLPGLAFAVYTLANVGPRAIDNHRWYRETFDDYPPERRALIPHVL